VHRDKFLIIKQTRYTYFSNSFLEWNSTCFGQFLCPSSEDFHCTHSNGICQTGVLAACEQNQDVPSWSCLQAVNKPVWHIPLLCLQWKTYDDGQRNCPKHVEFHSKNEFEKLLHQVGFIIRNLYTYLSAWEWSVRWTHVARTDGPIKSVVNDGYTFISFQYDAPQWGEFYKICYSLYHYISANRVKITKNSRCFNKPLF
jgi:hypothetical protein